MYPHYDRSLLRLNNYCRSSLACRSLGRSPVARPQYFWLRTAPVFLARGHCNQATKTHESSQDVSRARNALAVSPGALPLAGGCGGDGSPPAWARGKNREPPSNGGGTGARNTGEGRPPMDFKDFSKKMKMFFLKNTHKPLSFDNFIHLTGRWQYLYTKNQPCSSFGSRAMNSPVPKNDNFRLWGAQGVPY